MRNQTLILLSLCTLWAGIRPVMGQFHTLGAARRPLNIPKAADTATMPDTEKPNLMPERGTDMRNGTSTSTPLASPLRKIQVTSPRGYRYHPIHGDYAWHAGVDLRAYYEPVYSVLDGRVEQMGVDEIAGSWIRIRHSGDIHSSYAHLSRIDVSPGQTVRAGQRIGVSGNSGRSTGPHLHFRIIRLQNATQENGQKR
jgi:murein DD-endopeptidase